jgi:N-acetylglutamate synthase-like GNAT family acetyltransferase/DNA-binding MarR family transcriptional regulator
MPNISSISSLRQKSRKLIRELGLLQLNQAQDGKTPSHWHALIEIANEPGITITHLSTLLVLSTSATSRIVDSLIGKDLVHSVAGLDRREKSLAITTVGLHEIKQIDSFSNTRIIGALDFLTSEDLHLILMALTKYAKALEKSRQEREAIKTHTLSTSLPIRNQIINMIETIQIDEFSIHITPDINASILKPGKDFIYNNRCNFWYATSGDGMIIGSIGLKKINETCGEIKKFFVHKHYRGKGAAYKLIKTMLDAAKKNEFKQLFLGTVLILETAQKFYTKIGFVRIPKEELPLKFEICPLDDVFFKGKTEDLTEYLYYL